MNDSIKVNMENLNTEERASLTALIEKANKPEEQWEPRGGNWTQEYKGMLTYSSYNECARAEKLRKEREIINAWIREENERTGWRPNWNDDNQSKYFVQYDNEDKKWTQDYWYSFELPGIEYTSDDSNDKLEELLNKGLISGIER